MFKHLLVTLDGTPRSEAVIPEAIDMAKAMSGEVTLLRIVDATNSDAQSYLERMAISVRGVGVVAHTLVKQGVPAEQVVEAANEIQADVIVMATHASRDQ
jgi:nucleotide-binding universal stress UspA family protein